MLYVFCGSDRDRSFEKWNALVQDFIEKKQARLFRVNPLSYSEEDLEGFLRGQSLFEKKYVVAASALLENHSAREFILSHAGEIASSPNIFLFLEGDLSVEERGTLEKHAEKLLNSEKRELKEGSFNMYSLAGALGERDRKKLWVLYQKARLAGVSDEEIFWKLSWQLRNMLEVGLGEGESSLKTFVYDKTSRQVKNFSREELVSLSERFGRVYHETRSEGREFDLAFEAFILSV